MANVYQGRLVAGKHRFGVVVSRFNEFISSRLLAGCLDALERHGVDPDSVDVAWTPGSFEIPVVAKRMTESGRYAAVICLGAVVRGSTPHFDYIAAEVAKGVAQVGMATGVPTIFGVITSDTLEQAIERAGTKAGNKGADEAASAIEMANLLDQLGAKKQAK
ncbi:MAG: 6,7-dimethyl-8-ribityllumazine synthase [Planctomycetota bacterium]|nr:6,7-dimethyl-8-ribityllumazine synthase [Planctomycetota bacterium]